MGTNFREKKFRSNYKYGQIKWSPILGMNRGPVTDPGGVLGPQYLFFTSSARGDFAKST
jgi:hypothetical protein